MKEPFDLPFSRSSVKRFRLPATSVATKTGMSPFLNSFITLLRSSEKLSRKRVDFREQDSSENKMNDLDAYHRAIDRPCIPLVPNSFPIQLSWSFA
jgi:hypothetical protein